VRGPATLRRAAGGLVLRGLSWGDPASPKKCLGVHGWMDNAATFERLAPVRVGLRSASDPPQTLVALGYHMVALDLIGHGRSDHLSFPGGYTGMSHTVAVLASVRRLGWDRFVYVGHSFGGGIGGLIAGSVPESVVAMVNLDGQGGIVTRPEEANPEALERAIDSMARLDGRVPKIYPSLAEAVRLRCETVKSYPGHQYLTAEAARPLIERGTQPAGTGVVFSHDPFLRAHAPFMLSEAQQCAYIRRIRCPVLWVAGDRGWPFDAAKIERIRAQFAPGLLREVAVAGSHHLHAEPESCDAVAQHVAQFLTDVAEPLWRAPHAPRPEEPLLTTAPDQTSKL
jgi:pimeloyl-ACP methyl ester carboxylesterase